MAHIEPAGIGAEGRHHYAIAITGEAAPAHRAATSAHTRNWMQMACNLARGRICLRFMTKDQRAYRQCRGGSPAHAGGRFGIVITGDPDPVAPALQLQERGSVTV